MSTIYPKRYWGMYGRPESGKSTFLGSNAKRPAIWIDPRGRAPFVAGLGEGEVIKPDNRRAHLLPYYIQNWLEDAAMDFPESIIIDDATAIYEQQARKASMAGNMSHAERADAGLGKNKAADMVDKSNAMSVIRNAANYGADTYIVWHIADRRDEKGQKETRSAISPMEVEILRGSLAVTLEFGKDQQGHWVKVVSSRDLNGIPANTGFILYDLPDNNWRGGAEKLEELMYTHFSGKDEAIAWLEKQGADNPADVCETVTRSCRTDSERDVAVVMAGIKARSMVKRKPVEEELIIDDEWGPEFFKKPLFNGDKIVVQGSKGEVEAVFLGSSKGRIVIEIDGKGKFPVEVERLVRRVEVA